MSRSFRQFPFFALKILPGHHTNRKKRFNFRESIAKFENRVSAQSAAQAGKNSFANFFVFGMIFFRNFFFRQGVSYFKMIAIGCVTTTKYFYLPDCSLKISEKPPKFSRYLLKNKTGFAISCGAQLEFVNKKYQKSRDTVPFIFTLRPNFK